MYVKKEEKLQIIRWYIRKYVRHDKDISAITNLKGLEDIIRTHTDIFGNIWECNGCFYNDRDYCPICKKCSVCHTNDKDATDRYSFPYGYWRKFYISEN